MERNWSKNVECSKNSLQALRRATSGRSKKSAVGRTLDAAGRRQFQKMKSHILADQVTLEARQKTKKVNDLWLILWDERMTKARTKLE